VTLEVGDAPSCNQRIGHSLWLRLSIGLLAATLIPIGIHTVLLDYLGVPYPAALPHAGLAIVPDHVLLMGGIIVLDAVMRRRGVKWAGRLAFLFLTVAAINQVLFRVPIMRNVVSTKWTIYPFIDNLPDMSRVGAMVLAAMAINYLSQRVQTRVVLATISTLTVDIVVMPLIRAAFAGIIANNAMREGEQLYDIPYDWHVNVPSYLTSIEPAAGALIVALTLQRAKVRPWVSACVIFALQAGPLFRLALNPFYAPSGIALAILSEAQFTFEAIALALIVVGTSRGLGDRRKADAFA
jgi:hypothetical protein